MGKVSQALLAITAISVGSCSSSAQRDHQACLLVADGMPEAEVLRIMGSPVRRSRPSEFPNEIVFEYGKQIGDSDQVKIVLAKVGSGYTVQHVGCEGLAPGA